MSNAQPHLLSVCAPVPAFDLSPGGKTIGGPADAWIPARINGGEGGEPLSIAPKHSSV